MVNPSAIKFNGTSQYIILPAAKATIQNLGIFTWQAFVKPVTVTDNTNHLIWCERQGTGSFTRFGVTAYNSYTKSQPSYLKFAFGPKDGVAPVWYSYPVAWTDDRWHSIAFNAVMSTPAYEIIYDGVTVASGKLVLPAGTTAVTNTAPITVAMGARDARATSGSSVSIQSGTYWTGKVDDINIWNIKRSATDMTNYITQKDWWNNTTSGLLWIYRFTEGTGEGTGATTTAERQSGLTGTLYQSGSTSGALWTIDRPFPGGGLSDATAPSNFTVLGTPTTNITTTTFQANWNATTDDIYVQYYELQVSTVSNFASYVAYNTLRASNWTPTSLIPGTNYYWRVRAFDAAGNASNFTSVVSTTTLTAGDLTAPTSPAQAAASSIAFSGFTMNWGAATDNVAVTGYKIDVGYDVNFTTYLSGFRNKDVTNVLTYAVSGTAGSTKYYTRVRAYDAVGNESPSSNIISVTTAIPPDTVAPDAVTMAPATSVTSNGMTLNWLPGTDNVGVVGYFLDVGVDDTFATLISGYNNLSVGNVIAYPITGLTPDTPYAYRVRAVDAASNLSNNTDSPITQSTLPSSIIAGGNYTNYYDAPQDGYVDSGATGTNFASATSLLVAGNGSSPTKLSYLEYDLTSIVGTIQNAFLLLYITATAGTPITVEGPGASVTFDETTLTYANRPNITGGTVSANPVTANAYLVLDVSSLMILGNTIYTFQVSTTANVTVAFNSAEAAVGTTPLLQVDIDPTTATLISSLSAVSTSGLATNFCPNPSFETNITGYDGNGSGTITTSLLAGDGVWGSSCYQAIMSGTASSQSILSNPSGNTPALNGQVWTVSLWARVTSGTLAMNLNAAWFNSGGTYIGGTGTSVTLTTTWRRFSTTSTIVNASTAQLGLWFVQTGTVAATVRMDGLMFEQSSTRGVYFDGNTSGAAWTGTANNSSSTLGEGGLSVLSSYLGDANTNNTAYLSYKRSDATGWIRREPIDALTVVNHGTSQITGTIGKSYNSINNIMNPSLELDVLHWGTIGSVVTIQQDTTAFVGGSTPGVASGRADFDATAGVRKVFTTDYNTTGILGDTFTFSVYLEATVGCVVTLLISERDISGTVLVDHNSASVAVTTGFQRFYFTATLTNASSAFVTVGFTYSTATAISIWWDNAMLEKSQYLNPYIDGTMSDGMWEGLAHSSKSGIVISPVTNYDVMVTYTDPDGIVDQIDSTTTSANITGTFVTLPIPTIPTTTGVLTLNAMNNEIDATVSWTGDDNNNNSILVEWKRTDLAAWSTTIVTYDRPDKLAYAKITNLIPGVSYTVRVTFTDADNASGTYGVNPLIVVTNTTTTSPSSDAASVITFGGFMLQGGTENIVSVNQHDGFGMPTRRVTVQDLARLDGSVETSNFWGRRSISMSGVVVGVSRGDLANNLATLKKALAPKLQQLVINTLASSGRYYTASLESFAVAEQGTVNLYHLPWNASFICADPFAYDVSITSTTFSATNGGTVSLTNGGDLSVDLAFIITTTNTTATFLTITNSTTGERISPSVSIVSGDVMTIDGTTMSMKKNGVSVDYLGSFPRLSVSANTLTFATSPTTASITVNVTWRQRYL